MLDIPIKITAIDEYISACANRHENGVSCHKKALLFARSNCPVIYNLETDKVSDILLGHTDQVNGQSFVVNPFNNSHHPSCIVSTSLDKTAIIWTNDKSKCYKILHKFESPNNEPFISRVCIKLEDDLFITVTSTIDGSIQLWSNSSLLQTIKASYCCFFSRAHIVETDGQRVILVIMTSSDNKIHFYQLTENSELVHILELTGHNDWIKCLDVLELKTEQKNFLLASASQDCFIRVWHMNMIDHDPDPALVRTIPSKNLSAQESKTIRLTATLETVLSGHEASVYSICWFKGFQDDRIQLLSCSADKTLVAWRSRSMSVDVNQKDNSSRYNQNPVSSDKWQEVQRFGETGETNLPFLGVTLSEDEACLYALSLRGAIHVWKLEGDKWQPKSSITGHYDSVTDLSWEKSGSYLLSGSLDKTCRMHLPIKGGRWHEFARPQVHGHEINCIASINFSRFASGAEEKTIRTFDATGFFLKNYKHIVSDQIPAEVDNNINEYPTHAQIPALGLSIRGASNPYDNKQSNTKDSSANEWYARSKLVEDLEKVDHLEEVPVEELLLQSTLWWETNKVYGHSNELHALDVDSTGTFLASASKANRADLANIFIWETAKYRKAAIIEHHSLTITRLRFSPDDKYLLSVSRDRTWCLSSKTGQLRNCYRKLAGTTKTNTVHSRIIWDCCWTLDSKYFMTVSRDGKAVLWSVARLESSNEPQSIPDCLVLTQSFELPIQAVDSCCTRDFGYLFALGFEDGSLQLHGVSPEGPGSGLMKWQRLSCHTNFHHLPIRRLAFKPRLEETDGLLLASGADDGIVRLTRLVIN